MSAIPGGGRERLRATFDTAADGYDRARPDYPETLFERLVSVTGIRPGDRLLEVGCGTGKATRPLARLGFDIVCLELGASLTEQARSALAGLDNVSVHHASFETWTPPGDISFDLVLAATSWHWVDPAVRYRRAFELLGPGRHLAFWSATHVFPDDGDPFFREIQDVYDEIGEGLPPDATWPKPGGLPDERDDIEASGLFDVVSIDQFDWEIQYSADSYIALLATFSGHIAMEPWQRERLYGEMRARLGRRGDPMLRRHWGTVLHIARRKSSH